MFVRKLVIILLFSALNAFPQYKNELSGGLTLHTRSSFIGAIHMRYAKYQSKNNITSFTLDLSNIKNSKELRVPSVLTTQSFIIGKSNYLFSIRPMLNFEKVLFKKDHHEGVGVNLIAAAGPSMAIVKPYFVEYINKSGEVEKSPYHQDIDLTSILGNGGWYRGFNQAKVVPGGSLKLSLAFDYSNEKDKINRLETGFVYDKFLNEIEINPFVNKESNFVMAFVTISFGSKL